MKSSRIHLAILVLLSLLTIGYVVATTWHAERRSEEMEAASAADSTQLRTKEREEPDSLTKDRMRREAASQAAEKWYQRLLEKYPELRPVYRDVPDDQNGYLQFVLFAESFGPDGMLPKDIKLILEGSDSWDPAKVQAWLAENPSHLERILQIAELPDRSNKGISFSKLHGLATRHASDFTRILQASARLAFDSGDQEKALRHLKASVSLSDHFTDIEVPNMLGEIVAIGARRRAQESFQENFLPHLDPASLAPWNDALFRKEEPASEYSRIIKGEWNFLMREHALPELLGKQPFGKDEIRIPDVEGFADAYTRIMLKSAEGISAMGPDRFDVDSAKFEAITSGLDPDSAEALRQALRGMAGIIEGLGRTHTQSTMEQATLAVLSGNEMPLDPVSGKPFHWDPDTRTLTAPEGTEDIDPIKVP